MKIFSEKFQTQGKFIFAAIPGAIPITGQFAPTDDTDTYPVTDSIWGKGGHRSVADNTARDAITTERRREGMMVFVQSDKKLYQLKGGITNGNWVEMPTPVPEELIIAYAVAL